MIDALNCLQWCYYYNNKLLIICYSNYCFYAIIPITHHHHHHYDYYSNWEKYCKLLIHRPLYIFIFVFGAGKENEYRYSFYPWCAVCFKYCRSAGKFSLSFYEIPSLLSLCCWFCLFYCLFFILFWDLDGLYEDLLIFHWSVSFFYWPKIARFFCIRY